MWHVWEDKREGYQLLVQNRTPGRLRHRRKNNIKVDL
jgi:hypothetical protein